MPCGAKCRDGSACTQRAMPNGRCRMHGGKSLAGIASPTLTTGRYSKYLPTRLLERYETAQNDRELLAMGQEIALIDARLSDVLTRVDHGDSAELWNDLHEAVKAARLTGELDDVERLVARGIEDWTAWGEIGKLIDRRRALVESERKRLVDLQQMLTTNEAVLLITRVIDIVRRHVTDRAALSAIGVELAGLVNADGGRRLEPAGPRE